MWSGCFRHRPLGTRLDTNASYQSTDSSSSLYMIRGLSFPLETGIKWLVIQIASFLSERAGWIGRSYSTLPGKRVTKHMCII
jgi:hypothetical protein